MKKLLLALLLSSFAHAGDVIIGSFQGLNTQDNPVALEDGEAQDLLNVGITPGGKSVYKREGYGLHKTLSYSTSAVHGLHYFQDSSGSDIQLYGHDAYLTASVNGAAPVDIATGTVNATWQCTDNAGFAYCLTSSRNTAVRTSGTTGTTSYLAGVPLGTMVTNTPDRMVVAGVSGAESSLYFSQANTFTNFTVGINSADPFVEVINSPGSRLTHIRYACGKLLWWKAGSFGYSLGSDQFNLENVTISQNIGTLDNSSDEYNGMVYFRGQDNHIYQYDCANVTRLSRKISPTVAGAGRRRSNSWTQTSQSDFSNGVVTMNGGIVGLSTASVPGEITPSSFTVAFTSLTWNVPNNGFEANSGPFSTPTGYTEGGNLNFSAVSSVSPGASGGCGQHDPKTGSYFLLGSTYTTFSTPFYKFDVIDSVSEASLNSTTVNSYTPMCSWTRNDVTLSSTYFGRVAKVKISIANGDSTITSSSFTIGGDLTFYVKAYQPLNGTVLLVDDLLSGASIYFTSPTAVGFNQSYGFSNSVGASSVTVQMASNPATGPWATVLTSTNTSAAFSQNYIRTISSFTRSASNSSTTDLTSLVVSFKSTGTYQSAVNNATAITSWSTFGANDATNGGVLTYYVRTSTAQFTVSSSTPVWASQAKNSTVSYATGTYMQAKVDFAITSATAPLSLSDFSFNWFEGNAADKSYIKYWNDFVWVSVSSGTSGLNNRIQRWDILNQTWLLDDIAANGFLVSSNEMYFGSPSVGKIFKYGSVSTDDAGSINSYWKSKNFVGADPFVQNNWDQSDFVVKSASPTIMSVSYQLDGSTTTTYLMNLYNPSKTILHKGVHLGGRVGTFYNVQFGDNSSNPRWEVFGHKARYTPLPWRPE